MTTQGQSDAVEITLELETRRDHLGPGGCLLQPVHPKRDPELDLLEPVDALAQRWVRVHADRDGRRGLGPHQAARRGHQHQMREVVVLVVRDLKGDVPLAGVGDCEPSDPGVPLRGLGEPYAPRIAPRGVHLGHDLCGQPAVCTLVNAPHGQAEHSVNGLVVGLHDVVARPVGLQDARHWFLREVFGVLAAQIPVPRQNDPRVPLRPVQHSVAPSGNPLLLARVVRARALVELVRGREVELALGEAHEGRPLGHLPQALVH
mmetsp:Transcript_7778/g.23282  ORF Transcript_7778/g.23282 Transcript_7778/m.23282 type:complete len:261 (+) Transcript_7778:25-807(+)